MTHPLAFPNNKSGGNSGSPSEVHAGDRIRYDLDGRTGVLDECLSDGDACVTWDDGTFGTVKWNHLSPERPSPEQGKAKAKEVMPPENRSTTPKTPPGSAPDTPGRADDVPECEHATAALAYAIWDSENSIKMRADCIQDHMARAREVQRWLRIHGCEVRRIGAADSKAELLEALVGDIEALGAKIEELRARALALIKGRVATGRHDERFIVEAVRVLQGGSSMRVFFEGPKLKVNGQPHARTRCSSPLSLLSRLESP